MERIILIGNNDSDMVITDELLGGCELIKIRSSNFNTDYRLYDFTPEKDIFILTKQSEYDVIIYNQLRLDGHTIMCTENMRASNGFNLFDHVIPIGATAIGTELNNFRLTIRYDNSRFIELNIETFKNKNVITGYILRKLEVGKPFVIIHGSISDYYRNEIVFPSHIVGISIS